LLNNFAAEFASSWEKSIGCSLGGTTDVAEPQPLHDRHVGIALSPAWDFASEPQLHGARFRKMVTKGRHSAHWR
jgi:hypothetical protein